MGEDNVSTNRRTAIALLASLFACPLAFAQVIPKLGFTDPEPLPAEFGFDLGPAQTFAREFPPGTRLLAKSPATIRAKFQIQEARATRSFPADVSFWLFSADDDWVARISLMDVANTDNTVIRVFQMQQKTLRKDTLIRAMTQLKDGSVMSMTMVVDKNTLRLQVVGKDVLLNLGFTPAKFGAGAMGSKGWIHFVEGDSLVG